MMCVNPIMVKGCSVKVPCGKCIGCKIAYTREWKIRLMNELEIRKDAIFITLTFKDEYKKNKVEKRDLQLFLKRLRQDFKNKKLKYYCVGEYGEKSNRPHYHCIIFNLSLKEMDVYLIDDKGKPFYSSKVIDENWIFGLNNIGEVTPESIQYVTGYVQKKLFDKDKKSFAIMSKGIGKEWYEKYENRLKNDLNITMFGKNVGIPRYYKKKLILNNEAIRNKFVEKAMLRERSERNEIATDLMKKPKKLKFFDKYPDAISKIRRHYRLNKKRHLIKKLSLHDPKL